LKIKHHRKQRARQIKQSGLNGEEASREDMQAQLAFECRQQKVPEDNIPSASTVRRYAIDVSYIGKQDPYEQSTTDLPDHMKSYVERLKIWKVHLFKGHEGAALTKRESEMAKRAFLEFQDPFGEQVDLIAQFAVVWELAYREATEQPKDDIEGLFAYAPWRGDRYSSFYRFALAKGLVNVPTLRLVTPYLAPDAQLHYPKLLIGLHAQLGLPYFLSFIAEKADGRKILRTIDRQNEAWIRAVSSEVNRISHVRHWCNYMDAIEDYVDDKPTDTVSMPIAMESFEAIDKATQQEAE
jgi:hypothetical protein